MSAPFPISPAPPGHGIRFPLSMTLYIPHSKYPSTEIPHAKMTEIAPTISKLEHDAADVLLNTAHALICTMAALNEEQEPMSHWLAPGYVLDLEGRQRARLNLIKTKTHREHIQSLRLIKIQMNHKLTESQITRAGPLFQGLQEVDSVLSARVKLLEEVLKDFDIKEEFDIKEKSDIKEKADIKK